MKRRLLLKNYKTKELFLLIKILIFQVHCIRINLSRIESDLNIAQTVVQQLASQVEQAKLQVNKDTPVFTTIKPVTVPFEKSAPKRSLIVMVFGFLGIIASVGYVLVKEPLIEIIKSIKS
jgi:uncharacterized protein involved in exopolysaccharide biosynthesis